ncbi:hypothetical protein GON26_08470 [Flavobacterium sp. GA093]|uniref:Uncharacterized protein n=1 Tax=Flavobacterium hydrocarbonoxydans TaxID=2683249 RepID=A0A6I4NTN6_9FLAO|nr:hypothetical protein [Flavobacterium hydrocarbonoxydans]MWB94394.1 hypothetical protein [Flavobacterium hydrocarbonoxydans]
MTKDKIKELQHKIVEGLKVSSKKMIENKKKINGKIVVYADGKIQTINAVDIKD